MIPIKLNNVTSISDYNQHFFHLVKETGWKSDSEYSFEGWKDFLDMTREFAPKWQANFPRLEKSVVTLHNIAVAVRNFSKSRCLESAAKFLDDLVGHSVTELLSFQPFHEMETSGIITGSETTVAEALDAVIPLIEIGAASDADGFLNRVKGSDGKDFFAYDPDSGWIQYTNLPFTESTPQQVLLCYAQQRVVKGMHKRKDKADFPQVLLPFYAHDLGLPGYWESTAIASGVRVEQQKKNPKFPYQITREDVLSNLARNYVRMLQNIDMQALSGNNNMHDYVLGATPILEAELVLREFKKAIAYKRC